MEGPILLVAFIRTRAFTRENTALMLFEVKLKYSLFILDNPRVPGENLRRVVGSNWITPSSLLTKITLIRKLHGAKTEP